MDNSNTWQCWKPWDIPAKNGTNLEEILIYVRTDGCSYTWHRLIHVRGAQHMPIHYGISFKFQSNLKCFPHESMGQRGEASFLTGLQSIAGYTYQKCSRGLLDLQIEFRKPRVATCTNCEMTRVDSEKTNGSIPNAFVPTDIVRNSTHKRI